MESETELVHVSYWEVEFGGVWLWKLLLHKQCLAKTLYIGMTHLLRCTAANMINPFRYDKKISYLPQFNKTANHRFC